MTLFGNKVLYLPLLHYTFIDFMTKKEKRVTNLHALKQDGFYQLSIQLFSLLL